MKDKFKFATLQRIEALAREIEEDPSAHEPIELAIIAAARDTSLDADEIEARALAIEKTGILLVLNEMFPHDNATEDVSNDPVFQERLREVLMDFAYGRKVLEMYLDDDNGLKPHGPH